MNTIITIGRQFGSGGHEIGEKLAAHYGIKYFDKELLTRAAKESGFCEEMLRNHDERPTNSFLYNLVMDTYLWICLLAIKYLWHNLTQSKKLQRKNLV